MHHAPVRDRSLGYLWIALSLAAGCEAGRPPADREVHFATPCPVASSTEPRFIPPLKLGHFTSADGVVSFVFDRFSDPPRIQFEGDHTIFQLTKEELRGASGGYLGVSYATPAGKELIRVTKEGQVELVRGSDRLPVVRDGDAKPLPFPTVTGSPAPKADPIDRLAAELKKRAIVTLHRDLTVEDSYKLDAIERVLTNAPEELFVVLADDDEEVRFRPAPTSPETAEWSSLAPSSGLGVSWKPDATGLGRFGLIARAVTHPTRETGIHLARLDGHPSTRVPRAPGVLWAVEPYEAIFVTVDGGRYGVPLRQLTPGGSLRQSLFRPASLAAENWPARVEHDHQGEAALRYRVKIGALEASVVASMDSAEAAWTACTRKAWSAVGELSDIANYFEHSKEEQRKMDEAVWKLRPGIVERCRRHVASYEAAAEKALAGLSALRRAMLDRLRDRRAKPSITRPRDLSPE